jgi:hypothetical protein
VELAKESELERFARARNDAASDEVSNVRLSKNPPQEKSAHAVRLRVNVVNISQVLNLARDYEAWQRVCLLPIVDYQETQQRGTAGIGFNMKSPVHKGPIADYLFAVGTHCDNP